MSANVKVRVGAEWINTFHDDACKQGNLSYRDDRAIEFCNEMQERGHDKVFCWGNDNAWERDFRHPDYGGDSLNWIDNVHFLFYSDHGGNWGDKMHIAFSKARDKCLGNSGEWKLGVKSLKWLVLDCCQCVLNTTGAHIGAVYFPPAHGIHMIFGYVGNGHDSHSTRHMGKYFGQKAGNGERLGNAWLDTAYSSSPDDNPIVIAYGASEGEAINRRDNESINWRDYDVTSANWIAYKYRT